MGATGRGGNRGEHFLYENLGITVLIDPALAGRWDFLREEHVRR